MGKNFFVLIVEKIPSKEYNDSCTNYAGVVELADTHDLGSCVARHGGSSPLARTICGTKDFY